MVSPLATSAHHPSDPVQQPVAAQPVFTKRRIRDATTPSKQAIIVPQTLDTVQPPRSRWRRFCDNFGDGFAEETPAISHLNPEKPVFKNRQHMLQVSVLIAMPSPERSFGFSSTSLDKDVEELPEMVLGVTRLPFKPEFSDP